ncbi:copper chaperone PCu(A)C [uncultured Roseovarius sp.]|uniref:copper chaperone PCu(A)C n=1 Tax=uncultured Roseovarius sp. TaxID=293344 RepID=UPI00261A6E43|nr:copper chaperone PCu(A)C [uncultured Roseovarius sp.]
MKLFALALLGALMLSGTAYAHGVKKDKIEIIHPHINEPFAGAKSAAAYMAISNEGAATERLIGIETPAATKTSLHTTEHGSDGVARMQPVAGIEIPAGETVVLEPGGLHVMLMGLTAPLKEGAMVPSTFVFEQAGRIEVEFMVDPTDGVDHSKMDHGTGTD